MQTQHLDATMIGTALDWGKAEPNALGRLIVALSRHTPLGRGGMRRRLFRALRRVHQGAVDTHIWGAPVRLYPWNNASERKALMRPDRMDAAEHGLLAKLMAAQPSVFVDIGANAGLYSLHAALSSAPKGRILAIEPNRALLERLAFNIGLARKQGLIAADVSVHSVAGAVSDYEGAGALTTAGSEGTRHLDAKEAGEPVAVHRLDTLLDEAGIAHIDLLKIDVEGTEDRIVTPFFATAPESRWPRVIIIEHLSRADWETDCIADCLARGYRERMKTRNNTILERRHSAPDGS